MEFDPFQEWLNVPDRFASTPRDGGCSQMLLD